MYCIFLVCLLLKDITFSCIWYWLLLFRLWWFFYLPSGAFFGWLVYSVVVIIAYCLTISGMIVIYSSILFLQYWDISFVQYVGFNSCFLKWFINCIYCFIILLSNWSFDSWFSSIFGCIIWFSLIITLLSSCLNLFSYQYTRLFKICFCRYAFFHYFTSAIVFFNSTNQVFLLNFLYWVYWVTFFGVFK